MSFIRIFGSTEVTDLAPSNLRQRDPAGCRAVDAFDTREFTLDVPEIAGF